MYITPEHRNWKEFAKEFAKTRAINEVLNDLEYDLNTQEFDNIDEKQYSLTITKDSKLNKLLDLDGLADNFELFYSQRDALGLCYLAEYDNLDDYIIKSVNSYEPIIDECYEYNSNIKDAYFHSSVQDFLDEFEDNYSLFCCDECDLETVSAYELEKIITEKGLEDSGIIDWINERIAEQVENDLPTFLQSQNNLIGLQTLNSIKQFEMIDFIEEVNYSIDSQSQEHELEKLSKSENLDAM
ncbi:MAG: hypothetical protein R3Y52_02820 [Psittacicella sp.]